MNLRWHRLFISLTSKRHAVLRERWTVLKVKIVKLLQLQFPVPQVQMHVLQEKVTF